MTASRRQWLLRAAALAVVALVTWAISHLGSSRATNAAGDEPPRSAPARTERALPEVTTLAEQSTSAFHARLFADEEAVVLVTESGFTTFQGGRAPEAHAHELGPIAVRQRDTLVFWRSKRLRAVSLTGDAERELAPLSAPPRYLLATEERLAWISSGPDERASLQTLSSGAVRTLLEADDRISAAALSADDLYWVSQTGDGAWTIHRVSLDGQRSTATPAHRGRPPSMLAVGPDALYYYDGPQRGVRKLSFDLQRETAALPGAICSPLAASSRIVCAHVGGLFEIPTAGARPRFLAPERAGPITALALTHDRAFWVADRARRGQDGLVVRSVELPPP